MSKFLRLKDSFGNDMWFGDCAGEVRMPAQEAVEDFSVQLQKVRDLDVRSDDVIVAGYPKSGNNWIHHMVTSLQKGAADIKGPIIKSDSFIFLDYVGGALSLPPPDKPRCLVSHLPFRFLPRAVLENKVKVVYLTRNPKDVFVSLFCQLCNMHPPMGYTGTWPQFFSVMLEQGYWYGDVFDHLKDWEKEIESHPQHPIYHCNYEDTKRDTLGQVERLNQFLGLNSSRQLCQEIVNTCQLNNMPVIRSGSPRMGKTILWKDDSFNNFFRKGIVGDWKNWFTVAQNEQFDEVYATKMADSKRFFVFEPESLACLYWDPA